MLPEVYNDNNYATGPEKIRYVNTYTMSFNESNLSYYNIWYLYIL